MNKTRLSDIGTFARGKSKHRPRNDEQLYVGGGYPLIQTGDIRSSSLYVNSHTQEYNDFGLAQSKLWPKGTLAITIAANIAEASILGYPMCFPDSVVGFTADETKTSEKFVYYLLANLRKRIQSSVADTGSIQDNINLEFLENLVIDIPELSTQQKIAGVLSALDDKIELNRRESAELEQMARTLYDYWFVQFDFPWQGGEPYKSSGGPMKHSKELNRQIPTSWEVKKLEDIISRSGTGLNPRQNFKLGQGENYYVTIKNVESGKIILDDKCDKVDDEALKIIQKRSDLQPGDILFTSIQPVGVTYLIHEKPTNWNINESVFTIRPNYEKVTSEYLYMLLSSDEMKVYTTNSSAGSVHKGIRHAVLKDFNAIIVPKEIIDVFSEKIKPILEKMYKNDRQSQNLANLRDWLLLMLMNGQARVE